MNVLVTGANGFLGSNVIRALLKKNYTVKACKRLHSNTDSCVDFIDKVQWINCDIQNEFEVHEAMQHCDFVIHTAAMVSFDKKDNNLLNSINIIGTKNIVNAALNNGIKKIVHISSVAALGRAENKENISELNKWTESKLNYNYAISKYYAEMEVWRGIEEGLNAIILNPSIILGKSNPEHGIANVFKKIKKGLLFYPPGGSGFVDVEDVANFCVIAIENNIYKERYIINAENLSFLSFFTLIAEAYNVKPPSIKTTKLMAKCYAMYDTFLARIQGRMPVVTKESIKTLGENLNYNNSKSIQYFNYEYKPIKQTINEICKS